MLFKTTFRHLNCFLSSVTTDYKDRNGLKFDVPAKITTEKLFHNFTGAFFAWVKALRNKFSIEFT